MNREQTLLYTDVVDSTAVNTRLGDAAMAEVWEAHDRLSRELLQRWRGHEVDRSDGFMVVFDTAADAAACAADYHRMLAGLPTPLRARAGIHTGPLQWRQNSAADVALGAKPADGVGIAKAMCARLMALAQGGQTLASPSAMAALATSVWARRSHGHWRLKGWDGPIEVFEIGDDATAFAPPPDSEKAHRVVMLAGQWVSAREVPNNLPAERDAFVGRTEALQALARHFDAGARLVTLHGPGGMGKTRLALRHAWAWRGSYPGGVWFCDLAQARSADGVLQAVAQGLDVPLGADPVAQLGRAIAGRESCLVILDNFEQVARQAEGTLGRWLDAAPQARFIVTSRELLGLAGEHRLELEPLGADDAVQLFRQRAQAASRVPASAAADTGTLQALVDLLDGLPLAIELAAARTRVMSPQDLLARMDDRFRLLASRGGRPDRQATLRATLDWSWELLSDAERSALAQLSVFDGGCDWAAIEAVLDLSACPGAPWRVDVVQSLVDKSLLRVLPGGRFGMLRSVQEFAGEQLAAHRTAAGAAPTHRAAAVERHQRHFACLSEERATAQRCIDLGNLVRACREAVAAGQIDGAVACLGLSWAALRLTGPFSSGFTLAEDVGALSVRLGFGKHPTVEYVAGAALQSQGDHAKARLRFDSGIAALPCAPDPLLAARLHCALAEVAISLGQTSHCERQLDTALGFAQAAGHVATVCRVLNARGNLAESQGHATKAQADFEEALALAVNAGDLRWQGGLLGNLGTLHYRAGRLDAARRSLERAIALTQDVGDRRWAGNSHCNLALVLDDLGLPDQASGEHVEALGIARLLGHRSLELTVLCNLGLSKLRAGRTDEACDQLAEAVAGAQELGNHPMEAEFRKHLALALRKANRPAEAGPCLRNALQLPGMALNPGQAVAMLCTLVEIEIELGNLQAAASALEAAQQMRDSSTAGRPDDALDTELSRLASLLAAGGSKTGLREAADLTGHRS